MNDLSASTPRMMDIARTTPQFVDGRFHAGEGAPFAVEDPSTGQTILDIAGASATQVERMIVSARQAQPAWAARSREERVAILRTYLDRMVAREAEMREVLMREAGCPGGSSPGAAGIMYFQTHAPTEQCYDMLDLYLAMPETEDNPVPLEKRVGSNGRMLQSMMRYTPLGVVAGISAYNFPYYTAIWKVLPALATGNSVILRPSPLTPISALIFGLAAMEAELPPGILSVMIEGGIEGAHSLTTHRHVDMVAFTGSSSVGQMVMKQAADTMKRLQLELGGKSAQIFLPDAVDQAIGAAAGVCVAHAGQGCVLGTRVFVPEESKPRVLAGIKAALDQVKIGPAFADDTILGPVISGAQVQRCEHFVKLAVDAGATVVTGGKRPEGLEGHYFEPTLLDTPDNANPAAQEEIFGPVVSVIGYRDIDHAVEMANDSDYGLSGYVFGANMEQALDVAKRIRSGAVNVNGGAANAYASMGGIKLSGVGRERGAEGIRLFQTATTLTIAG